MALPANPIPGQFYSSTGQLPPDVPNIIPSTTQNPDGSFTSAPAVNNPANPNGLSTDPNYIKGILSSWAGNPGANPSVANDPDYWVTQITNDGGLGDSNLAYWENLAMTPEGGRSDGGTSTAPTAGTAPADTASAATNSLLQSILEQEQSQQAANQQQQAQVWGEIQNQLGTASQPVTADDPIIKPQVDAYRNEQTRATQATQAQEAESSAYRGTPTGTADSADQGAQEAAGVNTGNFQASLMGNELTQRRDELVSLLNSSVGMLSSDQAAQVQQEIAALNGQIQSQGLTQQNQQFYDSLTNGMANQNNTLDELLLQQMTS